MRAVGKLFFESAILAVHNRLCLPVVCFCLFTRTIKFSLPTNLFSLPMVWGQWASNSPADPLDIWDSDMRNLQKMAFLSPKLCCSRRCIQNGLKSLCFGWVCGFRFMQHWALIASVPFLCLYGAFGFVYQCMSNCCQTVVLSFHPGY